MDRDGTVKVLSDHALGLNDHATHNTRVRGEQMEEDKITSREDNTSQKAG